MYIHNTMPCSAAHDLCGGSAAAEYIIAELSMLTQAVDQLQITVQQCRYRFVNCAAKTRDQR